MKNNPYSFFSNLNSGLFSTQQKYVTQVYTPSDQRHQESGYLSKDPDNNTNEILQKG